MVDADAPTAVVQPTLLLLPDISGFTRFVKATDIQHSRHIVEELLETLIAANSLGLTVAEIEGDAILFYRTGPVPSAADVAAQVRAMFVAFHAHLARYESQRICRCGACSAAHGLTLKIVAHHGPVLVSHVHGRPKLHGEDVIDVHRLLKNGVPVPEYALCTQAVVKAWPGGWAAPWAHSAPGRDEYDVGTIAYQYVPLAALRSDVPAPQPEDYSIPGVRLPVLSVERRIDAKLEAIFEKLIDLPGRQQWIAGVKEIELHNHKLNRIGTRHRCVIDANSPVLVTSGIEHAADRITFAETDEKKMGCAVWVLTALPDGATQVRVDFFVRNALVPRLLLGVLMKKKLQRGFAASLEGLQRVTAGATPPPG